MRLLAPSVSLLLCLSAAVAILWGGLRLGKREEIRRRTTDREPLKTFAGSLSRDCAWLEKLYESHLRRIAEGAELDDHFAIRQLCDSVIGIRQFSLIHIPQNAKLDFHVQIQRTTAADSPSPIPYFQRPENIPDGLTVPLSALTVFADPAISADWLDTPADPLLFWVQRSSDQAVVFHIDSGQVTEAIEHWVVSSLGTSFGADRSSSWKSPRGTWLSDSHRGDDEPPDFLLPVQTRFGTWELVSWDHSEIEIVYHTPTIAGTVALASLLGGCGIVAFLYQRKSIENAEQRVSFVNRVSHELRTPLTNIQLNADLAAEGLNGSAPEPVRRIALIRDESRRLGRLIDNVLTFSKTEQGTLQIAPQRAVPDAVVTEVLDQFAPILERRQVAIVREGTADREMEFDSDAFSQIIANLISNVEKYAADGKTLRIAMKQDKESLSVTVADRGKGIAARDRERIFQPFRRLSALAAEGVSGTGLGLTIARELAQRLGGTLKLEPSSKGAIFVLRIPSSPVQDCNIAPDKA